MKEKTPQDYANELLTLYKENAKILSTYQSATPKANSTITTNFEDGTGGIVVNVTTLNRLYPVKDALVTVFTGDVSNRQVIETGVTDKSGKTAIFNLKTPPKSDSQQAENGSAIPYSQYNVSVKSDGYVEQIAMNVPVFSGVTSVQSIDLLPVASAGSHTAPQVFDENNNYNL